MNKHAFLLLGRVFRHALRVCHAQRVHMPTELRITCNDKLVWTQKYEAAWNPERMHVLSWVATSLATNGGKSEFLWDEASSILQVDWKAVHPTRHFTLILEELLEVPTAQDLDWHSDSPVMKDLMTLVECTRYTVEYRLDVPHYNMHDPRRPAAQ